MTKTHVGQIRLFSFSLLMASLLISCRGEHRRDCTAHPSFPFSPPDSSVLFTLTSITHHWLSHPPSLTPSPPCPSNRPILVCPMRRCNGWADLSNIKILQHCCYITKNMLRESCLKLLHRNSVHEEQLFVWKHILNMLRDTSLFLKKWSLTLTILHVPEQKSCYLI